MTSIVVGNSGSFGSATATAADFAAGWGSKRASASSGALTIKKGVTISNADTNNPRFYFSDGTDQGMTAGENVTSNTEGPLEINSGGVFGTTVTIGSGVYLWSDDRTKAALVINVPCTVTNSGYIIGAGGRGSDRGASNHSTGGPAIEITSGVSSVSIINSSGAYIAGGGGGGVGGSLAGGGGGAGGGLGGSGSRGGSTNRFSGAGGAIGQKGAAPVEGKDSGDRWPGQCGGAGGNGSPWYDTGGDSGGAGGRMLPGLAVPGGYAYVGHGGGTGGGGGQAGGLTTGPFDPSSGSYSPNFGARTGGYAGGGGGGWGASGESGSSGGNAVKDNGQTYTLSNSGTIYGGT